MTRRSAMALPALLIAAFAINLDTTIVNVALPTLERELHASNSQLQWIVDAYNLVFAAFILAAGSLSDRVGRKGMLLAGLGLFGASSAAGGLAADTTQLIIARCFMGLGAAMVFPSTLSLISNIFSGRAERARAIGLWGATAGIAIALGPIVGGWLLGRFSWASIFFAMAPVAVLAAWLVARYVPTSRDAEAKALDRGGFGLSTAGIALLVFTIIEAPDRGMEQRTEHRRLPDRGGPHTRVRRLGAPVARTDARRVALRNPRFSAACGAVTVSFFTLLGFIFVITQYFQLIKRYDPLSTGVHLLPVAVSVGVASVLGTKLAVRIGTKLVVTAGLLMVTAFYLWVATVSTSTGYATIAAQMVLYGIGMGLTSAPATEAIMGVVPIEKAGVGSAVNEADATAWRDARCGGHRQRIRLGLRRPDHIHVAGTTPAWSRGTVHSSAGAALGGLRATRGERAGRTRGHVHGAAAGALVRGLSAGCLVAAAVAVAGATAAALLLPAQPPALQAVVRPDQATRPTAPAV